MGDAKEQLAASERDTGLPEVEVADGEIVDEPTREQLVQILAASQFRGPLPPPEMLAQYNEALPDGADRIVTMAEKQADHRRRVESRGQIFGFSIAMTAILGGIGLIADGRSAEGLVPLVGALVGLVGVLGYGEYRARRARQIKPPDEPSSGSLPA